MSSAASDQRTWMRHRAPTAAKRIPCVTPPRTVRSRRGRSMNQTARSRSTTPYLALTTMKVLCPWSLPCRLCSTTPSHSCQRSITKRVIQRGQYRCHGNNYHTNHPVLADSIYTAFHTATHEICQPARASDSSAKSHGARRS